MSFPGRYTLLLILSAGLTLPVWGSSFESAMTEAEWHLDASRFECRLFHPIHLYGAAVFSQRAGEEERFYLQQNSRDFSAGPANLSAHNPLWQETPGRKPLGSIEMMEGDRPVQLDWRDSKQLMAELQRGKRLVFSRPAWYDDEASLRVVVEPISFRAALDAYQNCQQSLLPVNYDQVARTTLYFSAGTDELSDKMLEALNRLALYAQADERVTRVFVDGHTDATGLRADNLELSRHRAEMIAQHLTDQGLPEDKITVRWHGERYPVASNSTAEGRSQNRRVTLRVDRREDYRNASRGN